MAVTMLSDSEALARKQLDEWLDAEPSADPAVDLAVLRRHYGALVGYDAGSDAFARHLDAFDQRVDDIHQRLSAWLVEQPLPLSAAERRSVEQLLDAQMDVVSGYHRLVEAQRVRWRLKPTQIIDRALTRSIALLSEIFVLSGMIAQVAPVGFWHRVGAVVREASAPKLESARVLLSAVARLAALAVLQQGSLSGRELLWVRDYLELWPAQDAVVSEPLGDDGLFWFSVSADLPPRAVAQVGPPDKPDDIHYFITRDLTTLVGQQLLWLEKHLTRSDMPETQRFEELFDAENSGLPLGLSPVEAHNLLRRLNTHWVSKPERAEPRQHRQYRVQVCAGLRQIWRLLRHGPEQSRVDDWQVFNDSPGGYAIMSVTGVSGVLSAGMVLALRTDEAQPWSICVVRWLRSERPEQVELGVQVLAIGAAAVSIGFRTGELRSMTPALMLPPSPPLRGKGAMVVKTGSYASRKFVVVQDGDTLYIGQGRVISLDMQTANIELFQYELDPYPG